jgi:hypothetical protein
MDEKSAATTVSKPRAGTTSPPTPPSRERTQAQSKTVCKPILAWLRRQEPGWLPAATIAKRIKAEDADHRVVLEGAAATGGRLKGRERIARGRQLLLAAVLDLLTHDGACEVRTRDGAEEVRVAEAAVSDGAAAPGQEADAREAPRPQDAGPAASGGGACETPPPGAVEEARLAETGGAPLVAAPGAHADAGQQAAFPAPEAALPAPETAAAPAATATRPAAGGVAAPATATRPAAVGVAAPALADEQLVSKGLLGIEDVRCDDLQWLWELRIARGAVTILESDGSCGKSSLAYDLAARVSRGRAMPLGGAAAEPGGVVLLPGEADVSRTVLPALLAAGADPERIGVYDKCRAAAPLTLPADLAAVQALCARYQARLLVIDPLSSFVPQGLGSEKMMRSIVTPLTAWAEMTGIAVLIIRHLLKQRARNVVMQGAGSHALGAAARSQLLVGPDGAAKYQYLLAQGKPNLADAPTVAYRTLRSADGVITVEWLGESSVTAAELGKACRGGAGEGVIAAQDAPYLLYSLLSSEAEVPAAEAIDWVAKAAGVSKSTVQRAATDKLHVVRRRKGFGRDSVIFWQLPQGAEAERRLAAYRALERAERDRAAGEARAPEQAGGD